MLIRNPYGIPCKSLIKASILLPLNPAGDSPARERRSLSRRKDVPGLYRQCRYSKGADAGDEDDADYRL